LIWAALQLLSSCLYPTMANDALDLIPLTEPVYIHRLPPHAPLPVDLPRSAAFYSVTLTANELSVIGPSAHVEFATDTEGPYRVFKLRGPFDLGMTGIMAKLTRPLAPRGVAVFVVSTYDTDWILIKQEQEALAVEVWTEDGWTVKLKEL
jgi:hypothetical protein